MALSNGTWLRTTAWAKNTLSIYLLLRFVFQIMSIVLLIASGWVENYAGYFLAQGAFMAWRLFLLAYLQSALRSVAGTVTVRNAFRQTKVPLHHVAGIYIRKRTLLSDLLVIHMRDGSSRILYGLAGGKLRLGGYQFQREELVLEFNAMLAQHHAALAAHAVHQAISVPVDASQVA